MSFLTLTRQNRLRSNRTTRKVRLDVEGCESRKLMSGATISGTAFQDLSGNGTFTDDAALANVTIDLYRSGSSAVFEHASTNSSGNFSFTGLAPGNYTVQQVLPKGFLPTGALYGYPVTVSGNQVAPGKDFEDFKLEPLPTLSNLTFTLTTPAGKSTTVKTLDGNVKQGDTVTAKFTLDTAAQMTLVAYTAPNNDFDTSNLQKQVIFSESSAKTGTGAETLTVKVPNGYFQVDFVEGSAIAHLATNSNVLYHAQDRFIDGATGGTQVTPAVMPSVVVPLVTDDLATPSVMVARKH
jgi:SdrD B-like domain